MSQIYFRVNFLVNKKEKLEKFLTQYSNEINYQLSNLTIERYWKIPEQFQASFTVLLETEDVHCSTYKILELSDKLSPTKNTNWTFSGPKEGGGLECILNNEKDRQPLKWAHLQLEM